MKDKHRHIHEMNTSLADLINSSSYESIIVCDDDKNIIKVNQGFTCITGYQLHEVIGTSINTLSSDEHNTSFYENIWSQLKANGVWHGQVWSTRKNGDLYPEWRTASVIYNKKGNINCYIVISIDISDKKCFENNIYQLVHYNQLNKLSNKNLFSQLLSRKIKISRKNNKQLAVLFLDIDGVKQINDSMGQKTGDNLLNMMTQRLCHCARNKDIVARWHHDQFVIVLPDISQSDEVTAVLKYIHRYLHEPVSLLQQKQLTVTTYIGISLYPSNGKNTMTLLENAAMAMHQAKASGGIHYQFYSAEMNAAVI